MKGTRWSILDPNPLRAAGVDVTGLRPVETTGARGGKQGRRQMQDHDRTSGRARRRAGAVGLLAGALLVGVLGPVAGSADAADAALTAPGAPAMPGPLTPGTFTAPVYPLHSVPAYATPTHVEARVRALDGGTDQRFSIPTPPGSQLLWGDWNRDGAVTPAVYSAGHWVLYDTMIGAQPAPSAEFDYGMPGDKPVVGDFNKDGRTDIGVVRGNVWLLREFPAAGPTTYRFTWGLATDVPVVGDWDGDGRDGVGARRGARWFLLQQPRAPKAGKATYAFTFAKGLDLPVVGDWDGDGKDTVGVVRRSAWFLRDRLSLTPVPGQAAKARKAEARSTVTKRVVSAPSEAGTVPVSWATPAGPTGAACATAGSGVAARNQVSAYVRPSVLLDKALPYDPANPALATDPVFQLRTSLLESERYLLGSQYLDRWYSRRWQRFTDIVGRYQPAQEEYAVRRPAMAALTTAIAARTGAHNDASVGRTKDEAILYSDFLVRSIACQHLAVTPGGWGAGWQTAHWANLAGEAAWLVWDRLTPQTREYVAQMIVFEADRLLTLAPEYWADANGTIVSKGNTHAEEDSWNAALLELAVSMMPKHPQAANWRRRAVDLETAAYATLADIISPTVVNGVSLADRLEGANVYNDGTLENHQVIQPDYMTNIQQNWWAVDFAGLAGRKAPVAALLNATLVYGAFTTKVFNAGDLSPANGAPYAAPGGTLYRPGSNEMYFPQPTIWGTPRRGHIVSFDAHALAYGLDTTAAWPARDALAQHVAGQLALVAGNGTGDGRTYSFDPPTANSQDSYNGREEYAASQLAAGWLALYVSRNAWDLTFNQPALDNSTYAPLPPQPSSATGWTSFRRGSVSGSVNGSSSERERLSP